MNFFSSLLSGLGNFWGGIKPYVSNPSSWLGGLAALGTGLGAYDIWRRQQAEAEYLRRQRRAEEEYQRQLAAYRQAQADWQNRVATFAQSPLNVAEIYEPAKQLIQRDIEAGLAARGLQPGGAYLAALGEGLMRNYLGAADVARAKRASDLSALAQAGTLTPGPARFEVARPQFPAVGDTSALGKYLQYLAESRAAARAREDQQKRWEDLVALIRTSGQNQSPVPVSPPKGDLSSPSPRPFDIYEDYEY